MGIVDPHPIEAQIAHFEARVLPTFEVRMAMLGDTLAGFVAFAPETVECLFVDVPHIGRGLGARLLALAKAGSAGRLWLRTFARNARARAFYERHGFVDCGHGFENMWNLEDVRYVWTAEGSPAAAPGAH